MVAGLLAAALALQAGLWTGGRNDDAELLLHGQFLATRYDALNPPLVAWAGWLVQQAFGPTLLAVRLLVTLGLLGCAGAFGALAQRLGAGASTRTLATLAPLTLLHQGFYPYINLSHSVFLTLFSVLTLCALLDVMAEGRRRHFGLLGLSAGLLLLTKFNAVLILAAMAGAVMLVAPARRAVVRPRLGWSLGAAVLVAGPVYADLLAHWPAFVALYQGKMGLAPARPPWPAGIGAALLSLGGQGLAILMPGAALALVVFARRWPRQWRQETVVARPAWRVAALVPGLTLALMAGLIMTGLSRGFSPHHLLPLGLGMVPLLVWLTEGVPETAPERRLFGGLAIALGVAGVVALGHFTWKTAATCTRKCGIVLPYERYAEGFRAAGFEGGTVVQLTSVHAVPLTALRPWFPNSRFVRPLDPQAREVVPPVGTAGPACLVVWEAGLPPGVGRPPPGCPSSQAPGRRGFRSRSLCPAVRGRPWRSRFWRAAGRWPHRVRRPGPPPVLKGRLPPQARQRMTALEGINAIPRPASVGSHWAKAAWVAGRGWPMATAWPWRWAICSAWANCRAITAGSLT